MSITFAILGILMVVLAFMFIRSSKGLSVADSEKVKVLTDTNFNTEIKNGITLVDFWADWCMPCKMMTPILNDVAEEIPENTAVGKLNIEQYQNVAAEYNVRSIPTMILFKNGKEINRYVGVKPKEFLVNQIQKA